MIFHAYADNYDRFNSLKPIKKFSDYIVEQSVVFVIKQQGLIWRIGNVILGTNFMMAISDFWRKIIMDKQVESSPRKSCEIGYSRSVYVTNYVDLFLPVDYLRPSLGVLFVFW